MSGNFQYIIRVLTSDTANKLIIENCEFIGNYTADTPSEGLIRAGTGATITGTTMQATGNLMSTVWNSGVLTVSDSTFTGAPVILDEQQPFSFTNGMIINPNGKALQNSGGGTVEIGGKALVFEKNDQPDTTVVLKDKAIFISKATDETVYDMETTTDLTVTPSDAIVYWSIKDDKSGIAYVNGNNQGFLELSEYTVNKLNTFVAVTKIKGVPSEVTAGQNVGLSVTVTPVEATNQTIVWSVKDAGTTGATINSNYLTTTAAGTVVITATIENGAAEDKDYQQDFTITVKEESADSSDPTNPTDPATPTDTPTQAATPTTKVPKTGDASMTIFWLLTLTLAGGICIGVKKTTIAKK